MRRGHARRTGLPLPVLMLLGWSAAWSPVAGQVDPDTLRPPPLAPASGAQEAEEARGPVSPGGAFARSLVVPGWGHMVSDAPFRGAVYVAAQSGVAWMIAKSVLSRSAARRFRATEMEVVRDEFRLQGVQDPDSLRFLAEGDPRVGRWDDLIDARGEQVEDWVALGIFLTLMGAADAFVAAHLADFPEPLSMEVHPRPASGGVEIRFRMPVGLPFRR
jgi:hypothetical protein